MSCCVLLIKGTEEQMYVIKTVLIAKSYVGTLEGERRRQRNIYLEVFFNDEDSF